MEDIIIDALQDLQYTGVGSREKLAALIEEPLTVEYSKLVEWLTSELAKLAALEEHVGAMSGAGDSENFVMELNGFLREYGGYIPQVLLDGPMNKRLESRENKLCLLDFLISELQAVRLVAVEKPHLVPKTAKKEVKESSPAILLKELLTRLSFPKPPEGINFYQIFSKVESKIKDIVSKIEVAHMSKPLLKATLSPKQWEEINYIYEALKAEYEMRRSMLLVRLDVTIQSFKWAKKNEDKVTETYGKYQERLDKDYQVSIASILAAREDLLKIEKTSSGSSREKTKCSINRHLIGKVPDRGGRAYELEPPPPEMPSFQQRQQPSQQNFGGGGRGKGDGSRGGFDRVKGGWNDNRNSQGGAGQDGQDGQGGRGGHGGHGGGRGGGRGGRGGGQWGHNAQYDGHQSNNPASNFFGSSSAASFQDSRQNSGEQNGGYYSYGGQGGYGGSGGGGGGYGGAPGGHGGYSGGGGGGGGGYGGAPGAPGGHGGYGRGQNDYYGNQQHGKGQFYQHDDRTSDGRGGRGGRRGRGGRGGGGGGGGGGGWGRY